MVPLVEFAAHAYILVTGCAWIAYWILALGRDLWYILNILVRYYWIRFDRPFMLNRDGSDIPIILVHGSSGNQYEWMPAIPFIQRQFPNHPIFAFSLDLEFDEKTERQVGGEKIRMYGMKRLAYQHNWTTEDYANQLHVRLCKLNIQKCILFGHSMGGLIAAQYECMNRDRVKKVVTFASPLQGAPALRNRFLRWYLDSHRHRQMVPDSEYLRVLGIHASYRSEKYMTIGSENDFQVPYKYAVFPFGESLRLWGYGHCSVVFSPHVWQIVSEFIKK